MEKQPPVELNITPSGKELIIRHGEAPVEKKPKSIVINGMLAAPSQFLAGKRPEAVTSHIQIAKDKGTIELHIQDTDPDTEHVIKGSLSQDSILKMFAINSDKRWTIQEFLKFIKTMRYYFKDRAAHSKLVESLQKWSVAVDRVITEFNDNKGNSDFRLETKVRAVEGLITQFDLNISIFQGYEKFQFTVEIGLDPKNTAVMLYLISDDLIELEIGQREGLIEKELAKFSDFACSKVVIS